MNFQKPNTDNLSPVEFIAAWGDYYAKMFEYHSRRRLDSAPKWQRKMWMCEDAARALRNEPLENFIIQEVIAELKEWIIEEQEEAFAERVHKLIAQKMIQKIQAVIKALQVSPINTQLDIF